MVMKAINRAFESHVQLEPYHGQIRPHAPQRPARRWPRVFRPIGAHGKPLGPAVAERVAKLEASGVITGYQAKVDLSKVGLPIQCVIELRLTNHGSQKTYDALAQIPELTECHRVTGDPCVIMQAAVGSMPELEDLINRVAKFGFSKTSIILSSAIERRVPLGQLEANGKSGN